MHLRDPPSWRCIRTGRSLKGNRFPNLHTPYSPGHRLIAWRDKIKDRFTAKRYFTQYFPLYLTHSHTTTTRDGGQINWGRANTEPPSMTYGLKGIESFWRVRISCLRSTRKQNHNFVAHRNLCHSNAKADRRSRICAEVSLDKTSCVGTAQVCGV